MATAFFSDDTQRRPSLFAEAPSELAQDAFLAWLFGWLNFPESPLCGVSRSLIDLILAKFGSTVPWQQFRRVSVKRQFHSIDLLVVLEFDSRPGLCLLIEDKVDGQLSNDLNKYRESVITHASSWPPLRGLMPDLDSIRVVVLKTGFDYDLPQGEGWKKVSWEDLWWWVQMVQQESPVAVEGSEILADWMQFQVACFCECDRTRRLAFQLSEGRLEEYPPEAYDHRRHSGPWSSQVLQYCILKYVFSISASDIQRFQYHRYTKINLTGRSGITCLELGNTSGVPWIICWFDPHRDLFYRLDWLGGMWGLSLRSYVQGQDGAPPREEQKVRFMRAAEKFSELLAQHGVSRQKYTPREKGYETTRVLVSLIQEQRLVDLAEVHREFMNWLNAV